VRFDRVAPDSWSARWLRSAQTTESALLPGVRRSRRKTDCESKCHVVTVDASNLLEAQASELVNDCARCFRRDSSSDEIALRPY
jgi:hypothetical protein